MWGFKSPLAHSGVSTELGGSRRQNPPQNRVAGHRWVVDRGRCTSAPAVVPAGGAHGAHLPRIAVAGRAGPPGIPLTVVDRLSQAAVGGIRIGTPLTAVGAAGPPGATVESPGSGADGDADNVQRPRRPLDEEAVDLARLAAQNRRATKTLWAATPWILLRCGSPRLPGCRPWRSRGYPRWCSARWRRRRATSSLPYRRGWANFPGLGRHGDALLGADGRRVAWTPQTVTGMRRRP